MKVVLAENDVTGETNEPFFSKNHIPSATDFQAFHGDHDIFAFAEHAKAMYKANLPGAVVSPLLRFDCMETQCFKLVVNEVESLDAFVPPSGQLDASGHRCRSDMDAKVVAFRYQYWEDKSREVFSKFRDSMNI
jgi:hypothetical protein